MKKVMEKIESIFNLLGILEEGAVKRSAEDAIDDAIKKFNLKGADADKFDEVVWDSFSVTGSVNVPAKLKKAFTYVKAEIKKKGL